MSAKVQLAARKFKVRLERASDESYLARIDPVDDAPKIVADMGLESGIMDLVNDMLIEIVREEKETPPDERG